MSPSEPPAPAADRWSAAPSGEGADAAPGFLARSSADEEPRARSSSTGRSTAAKTKRGSGSSSSHRPGQPRRRSLDDVAAAKEAAAELQALARESRSGSSRRQALLRGTSASSLHLSSRQLSASGSSSSRRLRTSVGSHPRRDAASEQSFAGASAASALPLRDSASEQSFAGTPRTPLDRRALYRLAGEQRVRAEGSSNELFPLELLPQGLVSSSTRLIDQTAAAAGPAKEGDAASYDNAKVAAEKLATLALTKRRDNAATGAGDATAHTTASAATEAPQPPPASASSIAASKAKAVGASSGAAAAAANRRRRRRGGNISARFQGSSSTSMTLNMEEEDSSYFLSSSHLLSKSSIALDPPVADEKHLVQRQVSRLYSGQRSMVIEEAPSPEPSTRRSHKINLRPFSLGSRVSRSSKPGSRHQSKKRSSFVKSNQRADSKEVTNSTEHNTESEDHTEVGFDNTPDPRLRRRPSSRRLAVDGDTGKGEPAGGARLQRQASGRKEPQDRSMQNPRLRRRPQNSRSLVPVTDGENRVDPSDVPDFQQLDRSVSGSFSEASQGQDHDALELTSVPHDVVISLPSLTPEEPAPVEHDKPAGVRSRLRLAIKRGMEIFPVRNPAVKLHDAPDELSDDEFLALAGDLVTTNDAAVTAT